jgi:hypothetical protein
VVSFRDIAALSMDRASTERTKDNEIGYGRETSGHPYDVKGRDERVFPTTKDGWESRTRVESIKIGSNLAADIREDCSYELARIYIVLEMCRRL